MPKTAISNPTKLQPASTRLINMDTGFALMHGPETQLDNAWTMEWR